MKKFYFLFLALFMSVMAYGKADTLFIKPKEHVSFELNVDTIKYPLLKGENKKIVTWMKGDNTFTPKTIGNKYYFDFDVTKSDYVYYKFKVKVTKADECVTEYADTIKYIHVYDTPNIKTFTINDKMNCKINEGDTLDIKSTVENELDVKEVYLLNGNDTIYKGNSLNFKYVPDTVGNFKYYLLVRNPQGEKKTIEARNITIIPNLRLHNISYKVQNKTEGYSKVVENDTINLNVFNHDEVSLSVNTNYDSINTIDNTHKISYTWNKDGSFLPKGVITNKNTITIKEYNKATMDGTYKCLISDGKTELVTVFNIKSEYPTANETIENNSNSIKCFSNCIIVSNAKGKDLTIFTPSGKILITKVINSDYEIIPIDYKSILFVMIGNKTTKVLVK